MDESNIKISRDTNEGGMMHYKTIMANLLTLVFLLVEPIITLVKIKASLAASISIRQTP